MTQGCAKRLLADPMRRQTLRDSDEVASGRAGSMQTGLAPACRLPTHSHDH